jgi:predicted transcriptional regulator
MSRKIAAAENSAMNRLYTSEAIRTGTKVAAGEEIQAFEDHKEYVETLESVLKEDGKESFNPNDEILD